MTDLRVPGPSGSPPSRPAARRRASWRGPGGALLAFCLVVSGPGARAQAPPAWDEQGREMISMLARWVEINTGTGNREGLERLAAILAGELRGIGFLTRIQPGRPVDLPGSAGGRTGPLVIARRAAAAGSSRCFLLLGHLDTVFEADSPFRGFHRDPDQPGRATGPGVADMKGGLVVMLFALRELERAGLLDRAQWTVLLDSDEEIGSLVSRPTIEAEARRADVGLVFEAAGPDGAMVRSRRGLGQFHLGVEGVAAHAGSAHSRGRSAIRELAEKVLRIEALTDEERGLSLNVGVIRGGTKRNVVPAHAEAWIDLRYDDPALGVETRGELERIAARVFVPGTRTRLWGVLHRPPKMADGPTGRLLALHGRVAAALGFQDPEPVHAGGGTDGSLTSAAGLPTLDSMGVRGGNLHTDGEFVLLESLPERAAIAAAFLRELMDPSFTPSARVGRVHRVACDGDRWAPAGGERVNPVRSGRKQR